MNEFVRGIKRGFPICLGYIPVSFTFGLIAVKMGFSPLQATLISLTNMASAGQFAGI
nr:AzlC family ABC transporter permease [Bacteroidales bacterium]